MAAGRVYIGDLHNDVRERDVERFFKGYGTIREVLLKYGYGFVEFDDSRDADDAVYELNGKQLFGGRVTVQHAKASKGSTSRRSGRDSWGGGGGGYGGGFSRYGSSRGGRRGGGGGVDRYGPPSRTEFRLLVENLSSAVSWQDLKDLMRKEGEVTYADAHKQVRNEGVVEFASYKDMKAALDYLDGTELNGRKIKLIEDKPRRSKRKSYSRSRSRSRSPGRRSKRSRSYSRSRSRSKSRSRSRSRSRDRSESRGHSKNRGRSRSRSNDRRKHSRSSSRDRKGRSKSRSPSKSRSRSKSPNTKNGGEDGNSVHDD